MHCENERTGICILSNLNEHHYMNICNMIMKSSLDTECVDLLRVKKMCKYAKMLVRDKIGVFAMIEALKKQF